MSEEGFTPFQEKIFVIGIILIYSIFGFGLFSLGKLVFKYFISN